MRKFLCLLFALILLTGCVKEPKKTEAAFYYPRVIYAYNRDDAVVAKEFRDKGGSTSVNYLLDLYLQGPLSDNLQNPFPQNLRLLSVHTDGKTVYMTVTDELATISGASLILACSCLGRTAMELTGCSSAEIRCESLLLDGRRTIFINENNILYSDSMSEVN